VVGSTDLEMHQPTQEKAQPVEREGSE